MKQFLLLLGACSVALCAQAQISITGSSLNYSQNFDALDTNVYVGSGFHGSTNLPSGWYIWEYGSSTTRNGNDYVADSGGSNSGDTYSYGSVGSTERALGTLASGSVAPHFGAAFINNTGGPITSFTIRYRGEQWRMGSTGRSNMDSLIFEYSLNADSLSDTTSPTAWTADATLALSTPNMGATGGSLDGNATGNNTIRSGTINATIPNGDTLFIRWSDPNITGSDDGMAVDSFSIQFQPAASNRPILTSFTPLNNATGVPNNTALTLTFDKQITAGAGNIYITNENLSSTTTIAAGSGSVIISGNTATVNTSGLDSGTIYHVTFDSTAFDTAGFNCYGLYDTTAWVFHTAALSVGGYHTASLPLQAVNPASNGQFHLSCTLSRSTSLSVQVFDLNGRIVARRQLQGKQGENQFSLKTSLPGGTYLIRMDAAGEWGAVKVLMQ